MTLAMLFILPFLNNVLLFSSSGDVRLLFYLPDEFYSAQNDFHINSTVPSRLNEDGLHELVLEESSSLSSNSNTNVISSDFSILSTAFGEQATRQPKYFGMRFSTPPLVNQTVHTKEELRQNILSYLFRNGITLQGRRERKFVTECVEVEEKVFFMFYINGIRAFIGKKIYDDCCRYNEIVKSLNPVQENSEMHSTEAPLYTLDQIVKKDQEIAAIDRRLEERIKRLQIAEQIYEHKINRTSENRIKQYEEQIKKIQLDNANIQMKTNLTSEQKAEKIEHNMIIISKVQQQIAEECAKKKNLQN